MKAEEQRNESEHVTGSSGFRKNASYPTEAPDDYPPHGAVRPILLLLVGASGSGRTTFYETHLKTAFSTLLKGSASPLEQTEAHQERKRLMKTGESFVYQDVVFDPQLIREAKSVGFEVKAVYVATEDPTLNLGRVLIRVSNGSPLRRSRGFPKTTVMD